MYESLNAAAKGLLGEACGIVAKCGNRFVVCGGWSPILRNSWHVSHPGTRDVDLLFSGGAKRESIKNVVLAFLENGYLISAKHEFQVLRTLSVGGRQFVFNVDLLHPKEGELPGELCVDQLSLPIPREDFKSTFAFVKSMVLPNANFVFDGFVEEESIEFNLPDGTIAFQNVPIIDEVGVLVTKSKSCMVQKRPRDIFDIFLAISYPRNPEKLKLQLKRLRDTHESSFASLECIGKGLNLWKTKFAPPAVFAERGVDFEKAAEVIIAFLEDLGFGSKLGDED